MAPPAQLKPAVTATVEIEVTPPGRPGTTPWWTMLWDGTNATVRTAEGLDGDQPEDWGIECTRTDYTDPWRAEGGTPYVIEQILDACSGVGATARIVTVHGPATARHEIMRSIQAFADEQPECAAELRRFALECAQYQRKLEQEENA